jgi:hypothetical protein
MSLLEGNQRAAAARRCGWRDVVDIASDVSVAATYLAAWIAPAWVGGERGVATLVGLMVMEFLVIHSSAFLGSAALSGRFARASVLPLLGLLAFYSLFALGIAFGFKNPWFLAGFIGLHANRLVPVLLGRGASTVDGAAWMGRWAMGAIFYLGTAFITVFLPVPRLGVDFVLHGYGSGEWIDAPYRALAMGFLYFTAQALLGVSMARRGRGPRVENNQLTF